MKEKIILDLVELKQKILYKYNISVIDFCNIIDYLKDKKVVKLDKDYE